MKNFEDMEESFEKIVNDMKKSFDKIKTNIELVSQDLYDPQVGEPNCEGNTLSNNLIKNNRTNNETQDIEETDGVIYRYLPDKDKKY